MDRIKKMINKKAVTFEDFDKLSLKPFAENLFQIMEKGTDSSIGELGEKGSYPISLNAEFGNGKTTFLKMFEHFINNEKSNYDVVFINAWESDFYGEPVIAILSEFVNWLEQKQELELAKPGKKINQLGTKKVNQEPPTKQNDCHSLESGNPEEQDANSPVTKIKEVIGNLANHKITKLIGILANQIIQLHTGLNLKEFKTLLNSKNTKDQNQSLSLGEEVLKEFNQRKSAIKQIKKAISEYLSSFNTSSSQDLSSSQTGESISEIGNDKNKVNKKLLIIVDELDRTRPDYAVHFLEDMKHFFDIKNVVFLTAVNRKQMEATVKCLYGQSLNFEGYYKKFFKMETNLPDPYKEAQRLVDSLIQKTNVKYNSENGAVRRDNAYLSCRMFGLTLREVENFVRILEMVLGDEKQIAKWVYQDAYSFFICLYMKEKEVFQKILDGQFTVDDFIQFIDKKGFDYKLDKNKGVHITRPKIGVSTENTITFDNHLLLGMIAYSFADLSNIGLSALELFDLSNPKIELIYHKIDKYFPAIKGRSYLDYRKEYFDARQGPPAVKICEKINQCKSAFNK